MAKRQPNRPPLTLPDYERIFRVIHGVLLNEQCDPAVACVYFGCFGAAILREHHRLPAVPVIGAAAYNFGLASQKALIFATPHPEGISSTATGFHCWIEADGWIFDFQAPLFREAIAAAGGETNVARKMFQKPLNGASSSVTDVGESPGFWYGPNSELREEILQEVVNKPWAEDLANICIQWYQPSPKKMPASVGIGNQRGETNSVPLSPFRLDGAW